MSTDQDYSDCRSRLHADEPSVEHTESPPLDYRRPVPEPIRRVDVDQLDEPENQDDEPNEGSPRSSTPRRKPVSSTGDFTAPTQPLQVKVPADLIQSLKLHSIAQNKTMSELVMECLTSPEFLQKAWISTRRAG